MTRANQIINLLWTGGWDSTFQLLQTVLLYKVEVQPYYIVDPNRRSMLRELMAIRKIKKHLFTEFPETAGLIRPIIFKMVDDIEIDPDIERAFNEFRKEKHMGVQYLWLASFCKNEGINDMQLSIEKSEVPDPNLWDTNLEGKLIEEKIGNQLISRIDPSLNQTKEVLIFKYFTFPLIHYTKLDMLQIAKDKNWLQFMDLSWFCLFPTKKNEPCGTCKPCIQTITEGFAYRMPKNRRRYSAFIRHFVNPTKAQIKKIIKPFGYKKARQKDYELTVN